MPQKNVTVHYRRIVNRHFGDFPLREAYAAGLAGEVNGVRLSDADSARRTVSSEGRDMCLLNPHHDQHFCFGELVVYKEGDVPVAETDEAGQVTLSTIPLDENEDAIRGSTFFMAKGAHLAIVHQDSSARFLQEYLNWMLRAPIGQMAQDEFLTLQPLINVAGEPVAVRNVRALKIRAEVEDVHAAAQADDTGAGLPRSFRKLIERQPLSGADVRRVLGGLGLTSGSLANIPEAELRDLEFELLVRKRQDNRLTTLPDQLIDAVYQDGLDRAAELQVPGVRRRGDAIVATYAGAVGQEGPYYALNDVKALLWEAFGAWEEQELI